MSEKATFCPNKITIIFQLVKFKSFEGLPRIESLTSEAKNDTLRILACHFQIKKYLSAKTLHTVKCECKTNPSHEIAQAYSRLGFVLRSHLLAVKGTG